MRQKLLFFDIDGTILPENGQPIPESTIRAIRTAQKNGHLAFINTGRPMCSIPKEIHTIGFDGYVCGCGTGIYLNGERVFHTHVPHDLCVTTVRMTRECRIPTLFESDSRDFVDSESPFFNETIQRLARRLSAQYLNQFSDEDLSSYTFDKILVYLSGPPEGERFLSFCRENFDIIHHFDNVYEMIQKGHSKATGIQWLLDRWGKSLEDCFAFGDSPNDLPMLTYVPNSIAMGNSVPSILPFCSYRTDDILADGICHAMEHFHLI